MSRIIPTVLALAAIGLFFGYINPTYSRDINTLRAEIRSYDDALTAADVFTEKEKEIVKQRANIPPAGLARVEAFLPDGVDNVQLILDLNALAERSGLTLSDFDITEGEAEDGGGALMLETDGPVESLELSVAATGNYASFKTFLKGAEWSLRPLDLVELDIEDSETGVYTYQIKFRIYWLR